MCTFCCCLSKKNLLPDDIITDEQEDHRNKMKYVEDFYKDVGRDIVENLLQNRQNGTFIIRPTSNAQCLGTLSVVQDGKIFHLNIRRRRGDSLIALGTEKINEKSFKDINSMINYYISNYLVLYSNGKKTLTLLLPYRNTALVK